jgi:TRAP-type uncharacterized transport system substrate-binding protein
MPKVLRNTLISIRELAVTASPFLLLAAALLLAAYYVLDPNPPKRVVLATGPERSDYAEFGKRYAAALRRQGIEVVLQPTAGSADNLRRLQDPAEDVDFGFVQGGSGTVAGEEDEGEASSDIEGDTAFELRSVGSLFHEPIWIFYREAAARRLPGRTLARLDQLKGWRVHLGERGDGAPRLMRKLLAANGFPAGVPPLDDLDETEAVVEFLAGRLDAIVLVAAPESPMVQMLLRTPKVRLYEFLQADAYERRFPYLHPVTVPRGVADLARDIPAREIRLIAPTAMLVAREDTHPALVQLFVQAAARIHAEAGWFARPGQFPSALGSEFPLDDEAERYYAKGRPFLQAWLPFWLANLIDRMWVALFSIIAILIPVSRVVPPLYQFRVRSRIFRWYRDLRRIEDRLAGHGAPLDELRQTLEALDARAGQIVVPLSYADELYNLRSHIAMVRMRIEAASARTPA